MTPDTTPDLTEEELKALSDHQLAQYAKDKGYVTSMVSRANSGRRELTLANAHLRKGWMRNKSCYCGSGRKFKSCCWSLI